MRRERYIGGLVPSVPTAIAIAVGGPCSTSLTSKNTLRSGTTKSGSDRFHGVVSDYYNNQKMFAKTVFMGPDTDYNPFHTNNFSAAVGGPIIPKKQL